VKNSDTITAEQPYIDNLSPLVNLSNVGKVGGIDLPTYRAGTLEPVLSDGIIVLTRRIAVKGYHNPTGRGYICAVHPAGDTSNLKKGERKALTRTNLTSYAKRMIVAAGDVLQDKVEKGELKYTVLVTLTYRKNVPDNKTAKKHLANFVRDMKRHGYMKLHAWVAQMQNGERSKQKGISSYRAKHGDGIHFHIITTRTPVELMRKTWRRIVYKWEQAAGMISEKISGVNVVKVNNASRYISRYITAENKAGTILGNLWAISAPLRKMCKFQQTNEVTITVEELKQYINTYKMKSKQHEVRQRGKAETVYVAKDWKKHPVLFFRDVDRALSDIYRFRLHLRTLEKILLNAQITAVQGC